jgi:MoaA/NifB/PqqE/SkfB family radical SAM enzyme
MDSKPFNHAGNFKDLFFSEKMNQIRTDMLASKEIKGCEQCYSSEKHGLQSMRQRAIDRFGYTSEICIRDLNIVLDNLCNLKCRMCNSGYSHLWYDEETKLYPITFSPQKYFQNTLYEEIDFTNIESVDVTGGEPLYSPHFKKLLKKIKDSSELENFSFSYITNGTIIPDNEVVDVFLKMKSVQITISVDAIGKLNDYIRKNSEFDTIVKNLKFYHNLISEKISINILSTIGIYNGNKFHEIENFFKNIFPQFGWSFDVVQYPRHLSLQHMPIELKKIYAQYIQNESLLNFMFENKEDLFSHFLCISNDLDKNRQEAICENNVLKDFIHQQENNYKIDKNLTDNYYVNFIKELIDIDENTK